MRIPDRTRLFAVGAALLLGVAVATVSFAAVNVPNPNYGPCAQAVQGSNGAYLPPECSYLGTIKASKTYAELMADPIHRNFICREKPTLRDCRFPGGVLDGNIERFTSELVLEFTGDGGLKDFRRTVVLPNVEVEVHSGPQDPDATSQVIETEMVRVQGALPPGDPDFASLTVVGGTFNGQPSPGRTGIQLSEDGSQWILDSSFEVGFTIHFVGAKGSALEGREGYIEGVSTMKAVGPLKTADDADAGR